MSRNQKILISVVALLAVLVCIAAPVFGLPGLDALKKAAEPTVALLMTGTSSPRKSSETATAAPVCSGPREMFILLIGSDTRSDDYYAGLSDSMRVVRVDFVHPGLMMLPYQRDLYVQIPGISNHGGITQGKLDQAYLYGNPGFGYFDGSGQGPGLLAATLQQNFGTRVDHYVAVNLRTFARVVDALGGIDVNLPAAVDGRSRTNRDASLYFPAGLQHLDGLRALALARLRPDGDLQRTARQNVLLEALAAKILSPSSLPDMPKVVEAFYASVQTDMGADEISKLLCLGSMIDPAKIRSVDFPPQLFASGRVKDPVLGYTFVWDVDFNMLRAYVDYFNKGTWPKTPLAAP
ncbi:MAG TPA: LCP family protein [Anaerolineales bacterium]|nr:LCP family protein [Anaerolineales bacterium]